MVTKMVLVLAGLLSLLVTVGSASAQEKLRLAWAGFSPTNSPIWVIEDRKLLQKMGVEPEIIAINASPTVLQALLANEIDAASISVTTLTSSVRAPFSSILSFGFMPNLRLPYVGQWSLSLERAFGSQSMFSLGYVGSSAHRLLRREAGGAGSTGTSSVALTTTHGASHYHGVQAQSGTGPPQQFRRVAGGDDAPEAGEVLEDPPGALDGDRAVQDDGQARTPRRPARGQHGC